MSRALNAGQNVWDPCLIKAVADVFGVHRASHVYAYMVKELELDELGHFGARKFERTRTPVSTPVPSTSVYSVVRGRK